MGRCQTFAYQAAANTIVIDNYSAIQPEDFIEIVLRTLRQADIDIDEKKVLKKLAIHFDVKRRVKAKYRY